MVFIHEKPIKYGPYVNKGSLGFDDDLSWRPRDITQPERA